MQSTNTNVSNSGQRVYTNVALTVIAGLLAVIAFEPGRSGSLMSQAIAQPGGSPEPTEGGMVSAGEQRKQMIGELKSMNMRLEQMQSMFSKTFNVKVVDMPPVRMQGGGDASRREPAPAGK